MSKSPVMEFIRNFVVNDKSREQLVFPDLPKSAHDPYASLRIVEEMLSTNFSSVVPNFPTGERSSNEDLLGQMVIDSAMMSYRFIPFNGKHVMRPDSLDVITSNEVTQLFEIIATGWQDESFKHHALSVPFNAWLFASARTTDGPADYDHRKLYQPHSTYLLPEHKLFFEPVLASVMMLGRNMLPQRMEPSTGFKEGLLMCLQSNGELSIVGDVNHNDLIIDIEAGIVNIVTSDAFSRMIELLGSVVMEMFKVMTWGGLQSYKESNESNYVLAGVIFQTFFAGYRLSEKLNTCGNVKSKYLCNGQVEGYKWSETVQELTGNPRYFDTLRSPMQQLVAAAQLVADAIKAQE